MGVVANVSHDEFPKQGSYKDARVEVVFGFDTQHRIKGVVVRDDAEEPGRMIIRLDDSRHVLAEECQWRPIKDERRDGE